MKKFSDLDYFILESCRKSLFARGIDLSHKQILNRIKKLHHLYEKFSHTQNNLFYMWEMYNNDPPNPPYNYFFETKNEAISFAEKARRKYNVDCEVTFFNKYWKLISKSK